jgi:hypothetical protein
LLTAHLRNSRVPSLPFQHSPDILTSSKESKQQVDFGTTKSNLKRNALLSSKLGIN